MQNISVIFLSMRTVKNAYFLFDRQTKNSYTFVVLESFRSKVEREVPLHRDKGTLCRDKALPEAKPPVFVHVCGEPSSIFHACVWWDGRWGATKIC